jgi:hypothetical protein
VLYDNAGTVGEKAVTGTGSVVLSDSPTLTGNISANVNLRADTLSTLLPLAGGASEIGYATDANALVRFNGTAGGAEIIQGGSIMNFTLTPANYLALSNPASGVYIDCNNITQLNLSGSPELAALNPSISNINIRFPNSLQIREFKVFISKQYYFSAAVFNQDTLYIKPFFQPTDPAQLYFVILADNYTAMDNERARINPGAFNYTAITFVGDPYGAYELEAANWTRLPLQGEGAYFGQNPNVLNIPLLGVQIGNQGLTRTLATSVTQSSSTLVLPTGIWMISGYVNFNLSSDTIATEIMAGIGQNSTTQAPTLSFDNGQSMVRTTANLPTAGNITLSIAPTVRNASNGLTLYGNVRATFTAGTITAQVFQTAIRVG